MMLPLFGRVRGQSFAAGAVAAGLALLVARPLLVGLARAGYAVKDGAEAAWRDARTTATSIRAEAYARHARHARAEANAIETEIASLRREIAALKAARRVS